MNRMVDLIQVGGDMVDQTKKTIVSIEFDSQDKEILCIPNPCNNKQPYCGRHRYEEYKFKNIDKVVINLLDDNSNIKACDDCLFELYYLLSDKIC